VPSWKGTVACSTWDSAVASREFVRHMTQAGWDINQNGSVRLADHACYFNGVAVTYLDSGLVSQDGIDRHWKQR
jgi:hypothetical protein